MLDKDLHLAFIFLVLLYPRLLFHITPFHLPMPRLFKGSIASTYSATGIKTVLITFRRIHSTTVTLSMHALRLESGSFPACGLAYTHQYSLDGRESPDPIGK